MKKIALFSLAIIASVALTGCGEKTQPLTTTANPSVAPAQVVETPVKETFNGTMEDLLARGKSIKCVSSSMADGAKMEGEFYVDATAGRTKSITRTTGPDQKVQISNMLMTKENIYMWTEGSKEGLMFPVMKPAGAPADADKNPEADKRNQKYDFVCDAWTLDAGMFSMPAGVKFVDQTAQFKQLMDKSGVDIEAMKAKAMKEATQ